MNPAPSKHEPSLPGLAVLGYLAFIVGAATSGFMWSWTPGVIGAAVFLVAVVIDAGRTKRADTAPAAGYVPDEPGLYRFDGERWTRFVEQERQR